MERYCMVLIIENISYGDGFWRKRKWIVLKLFLSELGRIKLKGTTEVVESLWKEILRKNYMVKLNNKFNYVNKFKGQT